MQREALEGAETLCDKPLLARCRGNLAVTLRRLGRPDEATDACRLAARLYRDLGNLAGAYRMLQLQSQIEQDQGLFSEARATLEEVLQLSELVGDQAAQARALGNYGLLLWRMGDCQLAADRLAQAMQIFEATGSRLDVLRARGNLGLVRRSLGDADAALACFESVARDAAQLRLPVELAHALLNRAETLLLSGRVDEAEACLDGVPRDEDYRVSHSELLLRARIAQVHGDRDAALEHARDANELARTADNPHAIAEALRVEAELLHAAKDHAAARDAILEALEHLEHCSAESGEEHLLCAALAAKIEQALGGADNARMLAGGAAELAARHRASPDPAVQRAIAHLRALVP